jgi:hypothetical protein
MNIGNGLRIYIINNTCIMQMNYNIHTFILPDSLKINVFFSLVMKFKNIGKCKYFLGILTKLLHNENGYQKLVPLLSGVRFL